MMKILGKINIYEYMKNEWMDIIEQLGKLNPPENNSNRKIWLEEKTITVMPGCFCISRHLYSDINYLLSVATITALMVCMRFSA